MAESRLDSFGIGDKEDYQQAQWLSIKLDKGWRYDHTAKQWHHWNGYRWAPDGVQRIKHTVALLAAKASLPGADHEGVPKEVLKKLLNIASIDKALDALATFPEYGTDGDDWDARPELMGVANGVVDLRTNTLMRRPDPDVLVTKTTKVNFEPVTDPTEFAARAPKFMEAMNQWTSGDPAMVGFLLLWFGASLFGFSPEQRFLLMTGIGRNGKGALKHAIMEAVGEYGAQYDANLYMRTRSGAARSDGARADLVALKGKRITFFSEPEGSRFNEEMLKAHTGGDTISARALYSNNIQTWEPTHSITFLVNDAPEVEDIGPSMAARVMVADFRERYDGEREDKKLYDKLKAEREGVLAILCWAASAWYASWSAGDGGITLPERVTEQSRKFMERNDPVAAALDEVFVTGEGLKIQSSHAYEAFRDWFYKSGSEGDVMSQVKFSQALERKGFKSQKTEFGRFWYGIKAKSVMQLAEEDDGAE